MDFSKRMDNSKTNLVPCTKIAKANHFYKL